MKPTNDTNACTQHDWQDDPWTPGMQTCALGCAATREAPAGFDDAASVVVTVVEERTAA